MDQAGYGKISAAANKTADLVNRGKWTQATNQWGTTQGILLRESKGVDFYNIEKPTSAEGYSRLLLRTNNVQGK